MTTTLTHVETFPTPSRGARNRSSLPRSVSLAPTHARPVSLDLVRQADDSSPDGYTRPLRHTGHTTNRSPGHRPTSRLYRGPDGWDDRIGAAASTSMRRANQATVGVWRPVAVFTGRRGVVVVAVPIRIYRWHHHRCSDADVVCSLHRLVEAVPTPGGGVPGLAQ